MTESRHERAARQKQERLDAMAEQVRLGKLRIRKMTDAERKAWGKEDLAPRKKRRRSF